MAPPASNRRLLIGVGILALLIVVNLVVRVGRSPRSTVAPFPSPQSGVTDQPSPGISPSSPPASPSPQDPSAQSRLAAVIASPLPGGSPLDAIQELRDRLSRIPPPLQGPPAWGRKTIPDLAAPRRNPFRAELVEPGPAVAASEALPLPLNAPPEPVEDQAVAFAGAVFMEGRTYALIRYGKEVHLVAENATTPRGDLFLITVSTDSVLLRDAAGETLLAEAKDRESKGFREALDALKRPSTRLILPIRDPGTASPTAQPAVAKPPDERSGILSPP